MERMGLGEGTFFMPLFAGAGERCEISLGTQCRQDLKLLRNRFVGQAFDDEGWNLLDGLERFRDIAVIAKLPCGKQFFDELAPRKVVGRLHRESCGLEVVPCVEQQTPVFITSENRSLAGCVFGRLLGGYV